ncbi:hypothetical protein ABVK25_010800 [Lepraria finkii]|uniref:Uncharacterized protein n=1 Tax=Lepraria finkii TaxID=1340010 RepID=A0ABR4AVM4_9LECA
MHDHLVVLEPGRTRDFHLKAFHLNSASREAPPTCASKIVITTDSVTTYSPTIIRDVQQLWHVPIGKSVCLEVGQSEICRGLLMREIKICLVCVQLARAKLLRALKVLSS